MNLIGSIWGGGNIASPVGLAIKNLPFLMCIYLVGRYGPGDYTLASLLARRPRAREVPS
jgi:hypothetical protein